MGKSSKSLNTIAAAATVLLIMAGMALAGDYYFDLNDDVLMKDILSGSYTGMPEANNIQMLYPISAVISFLYRINDGPDWYGIFLCFLQYLCVFIIVNRMLFVCGTKLKWYAALIASALFMAGCIGAHFVFVQYTFTCGFLAAAAAVLIMTHGERDMNLYLSAVLIAVAYLLRSEMLLLMLPTLGVGILIKWAVEKKGFWTYVRLCAVIAGIIVVSQLAHRIANMPSDWKEFNRLFDERTELYDFQYIPDYAKNREFYDSIGLSESEQQLLVNYNFGLDDEINADTLNAVAAYAASIKTDETPMPEQLKRALSLYLYRMRHASRQKSYQYPMSDFPWNLVAVVLYIGVILTFLFPADKRDKKELLTALGLLATLFACRSSLWLYIIIRGRDPIRITHPLYLIEIVVLLGMLFLRREGSGRTIAASLAVIGIISTVSIPNQISVIQSEMEARDKMRSHYDALYDYFAAHRENYYFIDVYTGVSCGDDMTEGETTFSEKMFDRVDNSFANHDLMGGWASKSPLYYKKLKKAGLPGMQEAMLSDNVYMVQNKSGDTDWIMKYYREKGVEVTLERVDVVADAFAVYSLTEGTR